MASTVLVAVTRLTPELLPFFLLDSRKVFQRRDGSVHSQALHLVPELEKISALQISS